MLDFHADRGSADVGDDNGGNADTLERRVAELEEENRRLRAKVADQARRLEEWSRVVAARVRTLRSRALRLMNRRTVLDRIGVRLAAGVA